MNFKQKFLARYQAFNSAIYATQNAVGGVYKRYLTLYAALFFALTTGILLGFTGDDCYGKIPFDSSVFWVILMASCFLFFQTFVMVPLTFGRFVRLLVVAVCGHYLSYQAHGFWSLANIDRISVTFKKSASSIQNIGIESLKSFVFHSESLPADKLHSFIFKGDSTGDVFALSVKSLQSMFYKLDASGDALNIAENVGVCKPYAFADVAYGHFWLNAPAVAIILICFFVGNSKINYG